jgi:hypothetical protein
VRVLSACFWCVALLLVCGCGKSAETDTTSHSVERNSTSVAAQASSMSTTESPSLPARDLLRHPTPRPPGVSAQFEFVGGAGPGACFEVGNPPQVRVLVEPFPVQLGSVSEGFNDEGVATYGQPVDVCFDGMGRGPVSVNLTGPHGFKMSGVLPPLPATRSYHYGNEWTSFDWVPAIEPSWPLGRYVITASNGSISQSHSLTLVPPSEPGLRVLGQSTDPGHNSVPPHSHATLFLTGFKGRSAVRLVVYRLTALREQSQFFSAAMVSIPPSGNTVLEIPTGPEPKGSEPIFIITARSRGRTLYAPFSLFKEEKWPNETVGSLPGA